MSLVHNVCKHSFLEIHSSELANIDIKTCNNIQETVNELALSAHLGHSCETG